MDFRAFNTASPHSSRMGPRSAQVLAKLGSDLRGHYKQLLSAPLPEELCRIVARLDGRDGSRSSR